MPVNPLFEAMYHYGTYRSEEERDIAHHDNCGMYSVKLKEWVGEHRAWISDLPR